jgi:SAM-dependent methyltransferase
MKLYNQAYFERWYRDERHRVSTPSGLARKVKMAVSIAEFLLARPIRSVLDVGCGEAPWRPVLKRLRPDVRYVGVDSSEYVVRRYGKRRGIRRGTVGRLSALELRGDFDLIVCADVLQYVERDDVARGLREMRRLLRGVAYIEAFTTADSMEGDRDGWHDRSAATYVALFRKAGLHPCGPHCYLHPAAFSDLNSFDKL